MYTHKQIISKAQALVRRCGTSDPLKIAKEIGVTVMFHDMGSLKGMYSVIKRNRFIALCDSLDPFMQRLVCLHELGHDSLHRELAADTCLREFVIYRMNTRMEYEANMFASEIILPDEEVLPLIKRGLDAEQIAAQTGTDVNLIGIKLDSLRQKGFELNIPPRKNNLLK